MLLFSAWCPYFAVAGSEFRLCAVYHLVLGLHDASTNFIVHIHLFVFLRSCAVLAVTVEEDVTGCASASVVALV
jgi:hypothetical protein